MSSLNGNGFYAGHGFPRPIQVAVMGQGESIPNRPSDAPLDIRIQSVPLEAWPIVGGVALLATGVGLLAGGFAVKKRDTKTLLFGLGSTMTTLSAIALVGRLGRS